MTRVNRGSTLTYDVLVVAVQISLLLSSVTSVTGIRWRRLHC
jgi:hypothetical protein